MQHIDEEISRIQELHGTAEYGTAQENEAVPTLVTTSTLAAASTLAATSTLAAMPMLMAISNIHPEAAAADSATVGTT